MNAKQWYQRPRLPTYHSLLPHSLWKTSNGEAVLVQLSGLTPQSHSPNHMFDFGDELTIESYRIPWLIWIQLAILCLLVFLLFCFTSDLSDNNITTTNYASSSLSSASTSSSTLARPILEHHSSKTITNRLQSSQGGEKNLSIKAEIEEAASTDGGGTVTEDDTETECSISQQDVDYLDHHPCDYFRLAKLAFLKCFGLDFLSHRNASSSEPRKDR